MMSGRFTHGCGVGLVSCLLSIPLAACSPGTPGPLVLNELVASNTASLEDEFGGFPDWVELHNSSNQNMSLEGWYLSDDLDQLDQQALPASLFVPPGGYLVLFLDANPEQGEKHMGFQLSSEGEELALSREEGGRLEVIDEVSFGALGFDVSLRRFPDGSGRWSTSETPSPGEANDQD